MNNKSIISNITLIENYIEKLEQENEQLRAKLANGNEQSVEKDESTAIDTLAVTNVQVYPFSTEYGKQKALAQVVLNDQICIRGLRVMDGSNGLFVGYPVDPFYKGEDFRAVVFPITRALREHIENCVLEKYQAAISQGEKNELQRK